MGVSQIMYVYARGEYNFSACAAPVAFKVMPSPAEIIWWKSHSLSTIKRRSNCAAENMGRAPLAAALIGYFNWKTWSHLLFCVPLFKLVYIYTFYKHIAAQQKLHENSSTRMKKLRLDSTHMTKVSHLWVGLSLGADTHVFWPIAKAVVCVSIWGNRSRERTRFLQHWEWISRRKKLQDVRAMSYIIAVKRHVNWAECRNVLWLFQCWNLNWSERENHKKWSLSILKMVRLNALWDISYNLV